MKSWATRVSSAVFLCLVAVAAFAQSSPPYVVDGPTVVIGNCAVNTELTCASTSYPSDSPLVQHRATSVPRGNLVFNVPVVSNGLTAGSCKKTQTSFSVSVTVVGPNQDLGEKVTNSAQVTFPGTAADQAVLQIPIQVEWIESAVTFQITASQTHAPIKVAANPAPRAEPNHPPPPVQTCSTFSENLSGPNLNSINLGSDFPFPFPNDAFLLFVTPAAAFQLPVLPVGIVYGPLGNGSGAKSSMQITDTAGTNLQFTNSQSATTGITNDDKTMTQSNVALNFNAGGSGGSNSGVSSSGGGSSGGGSQNPSLALNVGVSSSGSWDYSTETDNQATYGNLGGVATTAEMQATYSASPASNEPPIGMVTYATQPFWQDMILAVTNPQYAAYDYPAGPVVTPLGSASAVQLPVLQLDGCIKSPNAIEPSAVTPGSWTRGTVARGSIEGDIVAGSIILDPNGNIQVATKGGFSFPWQQPSWNTQPGGTTGQGSAIWTNYTYQFVAYRDTSVQNAAQYVWAKEWTGNQAYPVGTTIYGYATLQVATSAGTSGANTPSWNTESGGTTSDGTVGWTNESVQLWAPNQSYALGAVVLDSSFDFQVVTTAGVSGASPPNWATTTSPTTPDGTVTWTSETGQLWAPQHAFTLGSLVSASNPSIQVATTGGTSGSSAPVWNMVAGSTTPDGTVTWTNETDHFVAYAGPAPQKIAVWQWLGSDDCTNIASVDRFYVEQTQSATPTAYRVLAPQQGIYSPNGATYMNSDQTQTTVGQTSAFSYTNKVTSVLLSSNGMSGGVNLEIPILPGILGIGLGANGSMSSSTSITTANTAVSANTLQSQTTITGQTQVSTTVQGSPAPASSTPINVMQDSIYVGLAVQDPQMQFPPPANPQLRPSLSGNVVPAAVQGLPVVPIGRSSAILSKNGAAAPTIYAVQTPYGYVLVKKVADTSLTLAKIKAIHAKNARLHTPTPMPPLPKSSVGALSPAEALQLLKRIKSPSTVERNAIKRLTPSVHP
jgi:hypothetical protein